MSTWTFNRDFNDLSQVAEFIGDFAIVRDEIITPSGIAYNDDFRDRIPGIANKAKRPPCNTQEDTAIYLLQTLFRAWETEARVLDLISKGYGHITYLDEIKRFEHIVLYSDGRYKGPWAEYRDARLVPSETGTEPYGVLPKGKRTRGHLVSGRRVLVSR